MALHTIVEIIELETFIDPRKLKTHSVFYEVIHVHIFAKIGPA